MEACETAADAPEKKKPIVNSKKFYYNGETETAVTAAIAAIDE
jgi:hypothetical protein